MTVYKTLGLIGLSLSLGLSGCQSVGQNATAEEYRKLGRAKLAGGDFKGAVKEFDAALELDPNNPSLLIARGLARMEMGQLLLAIEDYTQALAENPDLYEALIYRGNANNQLLQQDAALADFSQAIALQPQNALALTNRAFTYYSLGQVSDAVADLEEAKAIYQTQNDAVKVSEIDKLLQEFQSS